jgi:glycosyltransferase involved in cell wall biosynthesis
VQFVLVGQPGRVDPPGEVALQHLRTCANVHFLGFKSPTDLPAYMSAMDVNVMWYRLGDDVWTAGIYPLKLHEYLAVGRPVVSTDLPVVRAFDDVIRIAANPEDWEHGIAEALAGRATGSPEQRRERARQNDWNARAAQLKALVEAMLTRSAPPRA